MSPIISHFQFSYGISKDNVLRMTDPNDPGLREALIKVLDGTITLYSTAHFSFELEDSQADG